MRRGWVLAAAALLAACGGDDDAADAPSTTTTTATTAPASTTTETTAAPEEPFTILVTNDDGVAAPGIDAVVEGLRALPDVEVVVVAPAENQSGSGDATTPGGVTATEATTASGYEAVAVAGEPADAALHGLDVVLAGEAPDLVVSGINEGQNLGPIVDVSGTVGAARVAARRGIPAVAISAGFAPEGVEPAYEDGVEALLAWLDEHRDSLTPGTVVNINVPTCAAGLELRGTVEVPTATDTVSGNPVEPADCASTLDAPPDDIAAFRAGFVAVSDPGLG